MGEINVFDDEQHFFKIDQHLCSTHDICAQSTSSSLPKCKSVLGATFSISL